MAQELESQAPGAAAREAPFNIYGSLSFRLWHGMCFLPWFHLLAANGFSISLNRLPMALSITICSLFNSLLAVFSKAIYDRAAGRTQISPQPIFILGHWRSGATFLHELLACDSQLGYPDYYQCFAPHHFLLTEKWFKPLARRLSPERRPMDNMLVDVENPQEDECALLAMGVKSLYLSFAFPNRGPVALEYLDLRELSDAERADWADHWVRFLKRVTYRCGRRLVLKSPLHTARLRTILEIFPDARFVHLARDPLTLFASTRRFYRSLNETQGLQGRDREGEWLDEHVFATFERLYASFEEDRNLIPSGNLVELRFEDLVADPVRSVQMIYDRLRIGNFSDVEHALKTKLASVSGHKTNVFRVRSDEASAIRERWSGYIERYGYCDPFGNASSK